MQRYRVNVPLFIGLLVGSVVLAGGSYGLYKFQRSRNASRLLDREAEARQSGDLQKSVELLVQYLALRVGDEEAMVRLSETLLEIAEAPRAEPVDIRNALGQSEQTVRSFPQQTALRRRLVDLYMSPQVSGYKSALDHISQLLNRSPGDTELLSMQSDCLFATQSDKRLRHAYQLIGFDEDSEAFDLEKATAPGAEQVYLRLAATLYGDSERELADRMIEQLITANPESGKAYLYRGQYRRQRGLEDEADQDIEKALELAPADVEIVIAAALQAGRKERYDDARTLLEEAIKANPANPALYQTLAQIESSAKDLSAALAVCERGLKATPQGLWRGLLVQQTQLQLSSDTPSDARESIKQMRELQIIQEAFPDYFEARLKMDESEWFEAAQTFEKYESFMSSVSSNLAAELNTMLGLCREKLGETERALEAYSRALQINPANTAAELGVVRTRNALGAGVGPRASSNVASIYRALSLELDKPEAEQDWENFDLIAQEYVKKMRLSDAMLEVLRGEIFMRRKMYPEAREELLRSFQMDKENLGVRRAAVKLFAADPDQGPVKALELLDRVVKQFGDLPILRLERADLLTVIYPDDLAEQLFALAEGIDDWTDKQKVQLWRGLAKKFSQLNDNESSAECLRQVAQLSDNDIPTILGLFKIAREAGDQEGMQNAQDRLLKVVGSRENATWLFTEAQRLFAQWRTSGGQGEGLERATDLVELALVKRSEWHELYNLKAELQLAGRNVRGALSSYDRAASLGRQDPRAAYQYIKLLVSQGRYADALVQLEKTGSAGRIRLLGQEYAECLFQTGRIAEAVTAAEDYVAQAPKNAGVQLWAGRLYSRAGLAGAAGERRKQLIESAGGAFKAAVEINPQSAEAWMALVGYYAATDQAALADDTIRKAQLALQEDKNILMFARCYETVGRSVDAESLYQQALDAADDSAAARVARLTAQFYLGRAYRRPDAVSKATPLINRILRMVAEDKLPADDPNSRWARNAAARLLAAEGSYQQLRDAERLLSSNSVDGVLPVEDRLLMAEILAPRPEPVSRLKASRLLEQIRDNQRLSKKSELDLARLYYALGEWRKCRQQIESVIARYPDDQEPRVAYLEMLLQRGDSADIDRAVRQVKRLYDRQPNSIQTREMLARVAYEKGEKRKATSILLKLLPRKASDITEKQLPVLRRVALRLADFGETEKARRRYELAAKIGGVQDKARLARFLGERVDLDQGLDALESLGDELSVVQRIPIANQMIRAVSEREDQTPEAAVVRVEKWLAQALREDPDATNLQLHKAELYDIRQEYDRAAAVYQKVLEEGELQGTARAIVLNNLAYLLALAESDTDSIARASGYIDQAVELLGPNSDILDTRAVIATAGKRFDDAIADLQLAVLDKPTAAKYYHLAVALMGVERNDEAAEAWNEAVKRGLSSESVSRLERQKYEAIRGQLE